ncbi:hypothetical protein K1T71_006541 [Dendrolimus kikuchii]|uniref:Uncharacterized protein n=1 Tax=Dendrolimus kikuchii TaxID=765133 RepID=A0ACC1D158_9NEOP|nr:hypothetical protein K1T71_006541 [Dendrolimus kikuchii]
MYKQYTFCKHSVRNGIARWICSTHSYKCCKAVVKTIGKHIIEVPTTESEPVNLASCSSKGPFVPHASPPNFAATVPSETVSVTIQKKHLCSPSRYCYYWGI